MPSPPPSASSSNPSSSTSTDEPLRCAQMKKPLVLEAAGACAATGAADSASAASAAAIVERVMISGENGRVVLAVARSARIHRTKAGAEKCHAAGRVAPAQAVGNLSRAFTVGSQAGLYHPPTACVRRFASAGPHDPTG